ncbi:MAG: recombinase family protein [Bryobacterales bacterium]|nr:recombinase family protein [Bryobacterales bacterium]
MEAPVAPASSKVTHCAIYTRKSTDEGLEQDFNSLDAQRESAEAYILSQRGQGMIAMPDRYDDGGFSGGNLERPALKRLLGDIEAGKVQCVVVYKVDRLSRSLMDFARIIETFEKHNVSFVSVTQQFNTTNSLGRLTLNILLSFAQFEREIIAERTRDKMSAARRKGKWIGGHPMLGYDIDPRGGRLIVNPDEAQQVRAIFDLYLDYRAMLPVVQEIDRRGWRTKQWVTKRGDARGGNRFTKGRLFKLLTNSIYTGKVLFQGQTYEGEHDGIVPLETWEQTQQILQRNGRNGGADVRNNYGAILKGLMQCGTCNAGMIHTYSSKGTRRYRYYVCVRAQQNGWANCGTKSISAPAIESAVVQQLRAIGSDSRIAARALQKVEQQRLAGICELNSERQAALNELGLLTAELNRLAPLSADAGQAVLDRMADLQERIGRIQHRLAEIRQELNGLEEGRVDEQDFRAALAQFGPVWEYLNTREQARIIRALVERVTYDGQTRKVTVAFRTAGIREMCRGPVPQTTIESL